ncbi:MAG: hypothetical protein MK213_06100 [Planctomycetes bacterium]|nr:hypothetical protein [Planctomycetota bacterium]
MIVRPAAFFLATILITPSCGVHLTTEFHDEKHTKYSEGRTANGELSGRFGKWTFWYENGNKWMEGKYRQGQREGVWTWWYENGQKSQTGPFLNGERNGPFTYWYRNGVKSQEITFIHGKRNGLEITWFQNENQWRSQEKTYKNGQQYGPTVTKDENGIITNIY